MKGKLPEYKYLNIVWGEERVGSNFPGMPIVMDSGADPYDCAVLCAERNGCAAWSASICGDHEECWLKHDAVPTVNRPCRVRGNCDD